MTARTDIPSPTVNSGSRTAADRAAFELGRAQTQAYYACRHLAEHRGNAEAREGFRLAQARVEQMQQALQDAEQPRGMDAERPLGLDAGRGSKR